MRIQEGEEEVKVGIEGSEVGTTKQGSIEGDGAQSVRGVEVLFVEGRDFRS